MNPKSYASLIIYSILNAMTAQGSNNNTQPEKREPITIHEKIIDWFSTDSDFYYLLNGDDSVQTEILIGFVRRYIIANPQITQVTDLNTKANVKDIAEWLMVNNNYHKNALLKACEKPKKKEEPVKSEPYIAEKIANWAKGHTFASVRSWYRMICYHSTTNENYLSIDYWANLVRGYYDSYDKFFLGFEPIAKSGSLSVFDSTKWVINNWHLLDKKWE